MAVRVRELRKTLQDVEHVRLYTLLLQDELCREELEALMSIDDEALDGYLGDLEGMNLIESWSWNGCTVYEARSNPFEEARQLVLRRNPNEWLQLFHDISSVKAQELCSYRKHVNHPSGVDPSESTVPTT